MSKHTRYNHSEKGRARYERYRRSRKWREKRLRETIKRRSLALADKRERFFSFRNT